MPKIRINIDNSFLLPPTRNRLYYFRIIIIGRRHHHHHRICCVWRGVLLLLNREKNRRERNKESRLIFGCVNKWFVITRSHCGSRNENYISWVVTTTFEQTKSELFLVRHPPINDMNYYDYYFYYFGGIIDGHLLFDLFFPTPSPRDRVSVCIKYCPLVWLLYNITTCSYRKTNKTTLWKWLS